jgi:hypothetical protein
VETLRGDERCRIGVTRIEARERGSKDAKAELQRLKPT